MHRTIDPCRLVAWGLTVLAVLAVTALAQTPEQVDWLKANAVPFETVEAGHDLEDLAPLREMIGDARIVGLGECSHGSREIFQMKHRLLEFLADQMAFNVFAIEASTPEAYRINDYVLGGEGDPKALIGGMYFWTWNTEEVLALVEWMRAFNASGKGPVQFAGFDMQSPGVAMQVVTDFLAEADPERAAEIGRQYASIKNSRRAGSGFGVATMGLPIELARGKHMRFSGFIKTADLSGGRAGLWWRADGPDHKMLAIDNMQLTGPQGTTDWTEYVLELDIPEEAVNINFGVVMPGQGKSWFDGLKVELDGQEYTGEGRYAIDFDFESPRIENFYASKDESYRASLDAKVFHVGRQSLRLESLASPDPAAPEPLQAARIAGQILDDLKAARESLREKRSAAEVDWVLHNADIVHQCMRSRAGNAFLIRDQCMAQNVDWILQQNPGARIVLWAHNAHISCGDFMMGAHLREMFGSGYVPVGFTTAGGAYTAKDDAGELGVHAWQEPPPESVESFLVATGQPRLILDLRKAQADSPASGWLRQKRPLRGVGAIAMEKQFAETVVPDDYDLLVYVATTTAARQLDTKPADSR